ARSPSVEIQGLKARAKLRPIERCTRIRLATGRDVAVPHDAFTSERRIRRQQSLDQRRERFVLRTFVRQTVGAFELDADREIVARGASAVFRLAGVPRALVKRDELHDLAVAPDERVSRYATRGDRCEIRMCVGWQVTGEQTLDPRPAEFPWRQAD